MSQPAAPHSFHSLGRFVAAGVFCVFVAAALVFALNSPLSKAAPDGDATPVAKAAPTPASLPATVLPHVRPTRLGAEKIERIGFVQTGPVLAGRTPRLDVPLDAGDAAGLRITRLYWSDEDVIPIPGSSAYQGRALNLWLPRKTGSFCDVNVEPGGNAAYSTVTATRPLPDGVYCAHSGVLKAGAPPPEYCGLFVVTGLAKLTLVRSEATFADGQGRLALTVKNEGAGEFNEGRLVVTLQLETERRSTFMGRWEHKSPVIPAGAETTLRYAYPGEKWAPGSYHFYGHMSLDHVYGDSEGKVFNVTSPSFEVATPASAPP